MKKSALQHGKTKRKLKHQPKHENNTYQHLTTKPFTSHPHPLYLPEILFHVFFFLHSPSSTTIISPVLFTSKLWYQTAKRVLYRKLVFHSLDTFRSCINTLTATNANLVKHIHLEKIDALASIDFTNLKLLPNLQTLEFYVCSDIRNDDLLQLIPYLPKLRDIRLPGCPKIQNTLLHTLSEKCNSLTYLDLRACANISDVGVMAIAQHCHKLKHLNVGRVSNHDMITDASIIEIVKNTNVTTLGLAGTHVTYRTMKAILEYASKSIERISLNNCSMIDNRATQIAIELQKLLVFEVKGCVHVTEKGPLKRLIRKKVRLEIEAEKRAALLYFCLKK